MTKIYNSAVVIIPPKEVWPPIERIRLKHDKQVSRWMPHITLLYPFRPLYEFNALKEQFLKMLEPVPSFEIILRTFNYFKHNHHSYTLWLNPEPSKPIIALQKRINALVPDCDDVTKFKGGFNPHLSIGQFNSEQAFRKKHESLQNAWMPLSFIIDEISLIWREPHKNSRFKVEQKVPLNGEIRR